MNCNYTPKHMWNSFSSGREMEKWYPRVVWCLQSVATSFCELIAGFIYQTAPGSAVVAAAFSHHETHSDSNNLLRDHSKPMEDSWSPSAFLCPPEQILLSWHRQIPRWFPGARITCSLVWILFKQKDMTNCLVTLINGCPWGIVRHEMKLNNSSVHYSPLPHHLKCLIVPKKWIPF